MSEGQTNRKDGKRELSKSETENDEINEDKKKGREN